MMLVSSRYNIFEKKNNWIKSRHDIMLCQEEKLEGFGWIFMSNHSFIKKVKVSIYKKITYLSFNQLWKKTKKVTN